MAGPDPACAELPEFDLGAGLPGSLSIARGTPPIVV
jgi:hypothetical protein